MIVIGRGSRDPKAERGRRADRMLKGQTLKPGVSRTGKLIRARDGGARRRPIRRVEESKCARPDTGGRFLRGSVDRSDTGLGRPAKYRAR